MSKINQPTVFCYGEVLWDIFPEGKQAGGAPFNVAYNLKRMGIDTHMISRVGADDLGDKLITKIKGWDLPVEDLQLDTANPTGTVTATIDSNNEANYEIVTNVAWDFIELREDYKEQIKNADALIFGSLIARNTTSYNTLLELLELAPYKVFDVNIREPYFSIDVAKTLLAKCDLVKMNETELQTITQLLGQAYTTDDDCVNYIKERFNISGVIITMGSKGALYYEDTLKYNFPARPVTVKDTVGSGDAFLAGFVSKKLSGGSPVEAMKQAVSLGAFITSNAGACPEYVFKDFQEFCESELAFS
ncbi:carbohydrate kinase family protein [Leeuwenhoekiella sp. MAR_2009_132]|uniref:carbohydrate kinase family protein n=1 Tax=Leeuwenhoekiella sp. MAR_2009_132 TaxID=1392489 RepID=UPI000490DFE7|nr:carbohydrate kinase [Leeuwenhoekiella sp. MAR_2009_132]